MLEPNFKIKTVEENETFGKFTIEPLEQGYGHTLGNALRRVLLKSMAGAAVTTVKIAGVRHPFSTPYGMAEDVIELILNIKKIRIKLEGGKPTKMILEETGPKEVLAKDIKAPPEVTIVNPDLHLANLSDKKSKLEIEMMAEQGYGYSLSDERKTGEIGLIPIDAIFTPVLQVTYKVEATRVGRMINLDKLILEIKTDETVRPKEALKEAAKILVDYFLQIYEPKAVVEEGVAVTPAISEEILKMTIEELDLATRVVNALKNGGVETVGQLLGTPRKDLTKIKNLGAKSLSAIEEKLREKGVALSV